MASRAVPRSAPRRGYRSTGTGAAPCPSRSEGVEGVGGAGVRFRLFPRDDGFYPLFDDAAENVAECARRFRDLLDHYSDQQVTEPVTRDVEKLVNLISDCETRGDQITRTILVRLNKSFVTPFDREDINALAE